MIPDQNKRRQETNIHLDEFGDYNNGKNIRIKMSLFDKNEELGKEIIVKWYIILFGIWIWIIGHHDIILAVL